LQGEKMPVQVIAGCMFSGKTNELCRRIIRFLLAKKKVAIFSPKCDTRKTRSVSGLLRKSLPENVKISIPETIGVRSPTDILRALRKKRKIEVVAIDEAQFFSKRQSQRFLDFLTRTQKGRIIIVAGLDTDFLHRPFGVMPAVLAVADEIVKLTAVCEKCGNDRASYTQRLINGRPASSNSPIVLIGDKESYEPRCEKCFEVGS
jgi:thymidine kinase